MVLPNKRRWQRSAVPGNVSSYQYDGHTVWNSAQYSDTGIPQNLVVGKVVMRIPWFGWITMIMRDNSWGLPIIIAIILAIVIVEFVIPILRQKKPSEQKPNPVRHRCSQLWIRVFRTFKTKRNKWVQIKATISFENIDVAALNKNLRSPTRLFFFLFKR